MRRRIFGVTLLFITALAVARDRKGPITGTWNCEAHGSSRGDMAVTLYLQQDKENVDGTISSAIGETQISSGTFKRNMLEIHVDTPEGPYVLVAKITKGTLSGTWSSDTEKGSWQGKKQPAGSK
jgi:hypothetical protein